MTALDTLEYLAVLCCNSGCLLDLMHWPVTVLKKANHIVWQASTQKPTRFVPGDMVMQMPEQQKQMSVGCIRQ